MTTFDRISHGLLALGALAALALASGCATTGSSGRRFDYFAAASGGEDDPWFPKVEEWQGRAQAEGTRLPRMTRSPEAARNSGQLLEKLGAFRDMERRRLARDIHDLGLVLARRFYRFDPSEDPLYDHWPTVGQLLANNGDDCDGLDLIGYQLLREFGFPPEQVYRGVVRRDRDGANHMVTLWFEQPDDPWVLDATGAVAVEFHRLSELPGWTPTKIFNERIQYNVVEAAGREAPGPLSHLDGAGRPVAIGR